MSEQLTQSNECNSSNCAATRFTARPVFQVTENDNGVDLEVRLPGVPNDQAVLTVQENILTIVGQRQDSVPENWEIRQNSPSPDAYELRVRLHRSLDPGGTTAKLSDGILRLQVPKKAEARARRIELS